MINHQILLLVVCSLPILTTQTTYAYSCDNSTCVSCWSSNTCNYVCQPGYRFTSWMCTKCPAGCLFCDATLTLCNYCEGSSGVSLPSHTCVPCDDVNCVSCPTDKTTCDYCNLGMGVMGVGCVACNDVNCKNCGANYLVCY